MMGEHIRALKGGRWIHAIDCGDETVLHLVEDGAPPCVRRAYRPEFVAGAKSVEIVTHRERTYPAKEIVRRAYSRAADPALAAMFRDSEAFAGWCTTGRLSEPHNVIGAPAVQLPAAAGTPAPRRGSPRSGRTRVRARPKPSGRPATGAKRTAAKWKPQQAAKKVVRAAKRAAPRSKAVKRSKRAKRSAGRR